MKMSYVKTKDGLKVFYQHIHKKKSMPTIVFVHGWAVDNTFFSDMIGYFSSKSYNVLFLDLRGHGKSDSPNSVEGFNLDYVAEDLNDILIHEKIGKCVLVGHSMGGMVSMLFALKYKSKVAKMVLLNSYFQSPLKSSSLKFFREDKEFAKKIIDAVVVSSKEKEHKMDIDYSKHKRMLDASILIKGIRANSVRDCFCYIDAMISFDVKFKLKMLNVPILVIGAKKDQFFPKGETEEFASLIPGSVLRIFDGTHSLPLKKPLMIAEEIELFIR